MKIYSEICNVRNKESKVSSSGKQYFSISVSYVVFSKQYNADREIFESFVVPQKVYDNVKVGENIRLVGIAQYTKEKGQSYNFYDLYEGK